MSCRVCKGDIVDLDLADDLRRLFSVVSERVDARLAIHEKEHSSGCSGGLGEVDEVRSEDRQVGGGDDDGQQNTRIISAEGP